MLNVKCSIKSIPSWVFEDLLIRFVWVVCQQQMGDSVHSQLIHSWGRSKSASNAPLPSSAVVRAPSSRGSCKRSLPPARSTCKLIWNKHRPTQKYIFSFSFQLWTERCPCQTSSTIAATAAMTTKSPFWLPQKTRLWGLAHAHAGFKMRYPSKKCLFIHCCTV